MRPSTIACPSFGALPEQIQFVGADVAQGALKCLAVAQRAIPRNTHLARAAMHGHSADGGAEARAQDAPDGRLAAAVVRDSRA